jgi:2-polyprenyl-6-methoxyphenol hydroxylase-like FAD-dependent oxidoreductase
MMDAGLWLTGMRSIIHGHPTQDAENPGLDLPYAQLGIPQYETERLLTQHLSRHGVAIERGVAFIGMDPDDEGVSVKLQHADDTVEEARFDYVVGCDGAHSAVRKAAGIAFEGEAYPWPFMIGDVHIDWDLPYGSALRAVRPVEGGPPDIFIAIPLPERGRYRVSMLATGGIAASGGTEHGIQTELKGPTLDELQAVAHDLLPDKPPLSDLRWSSIFRISLRLANRYQHGRAFIAGDAAHIHPPTGGQGMNTGIQDAYNLAWKLALVVKRQAPRTLLESYETERRPVGEEVLARTHAASRGYGREQGGVPDRLADTQILVSYRGTPWAHDDTAPDTPGLRAGDRAPDVQGLHRSGLGFPIRLFDTLKGIDHVLLVPMVGPDPEQESADLAAFSRGLADMFGLPLRVIAVSATPLAEQPCLTVLSDQSGGFAAAYGTSTTLVRPDGYIAWRGGSWHDEGLLAHLGNYLRPNSSP